MSAHINITYDEGVELTDEELDAFAVLGLSARRQSGRWHVTGDLGASSSSGAFVKMNVPESPHG